MKHEFNSIRNYLDSRKILLLILISFFSNLLNISVLGQNLDVPQTLDYLNKKFQDFPFKHGSGDDIYTKFRLTQFGELEIIESFYGRNYQGETELTWKRIYRIPIDNIDLKMSFPQYESNSIQDAIFLYLTLDGSYYREEINAEEVQYVKETVPAQSTDMLGTHRNSLCIGIGDAGSKQNIKNALEHLCILVIGNPVKYGLSNRPVDPFATRIDEEVSDITFEGSSNIIKLVLSPGGVYEIPILLNDVLKINFIFDSGASEVSISPDVALTLIRTGTITEDDWLPSQSYRFADGSTAKSSRFLIKKFKIGNQILSNIEASISNSIEAPILVGQNVLQKLGNFTIDNKNQLLIINPK